MVIALRGDVWVVVLSAYTASLVDAGFIRAIAVIAKLALFEFAARKRYASYTEGTYDR